VSEISVRDLQQKHAAGEPLFLLDVREPDELAVAAIDWATAIPMAEVPARVGELPRDVPIAVLCHSGARSGRVTRWLNDNGFPSAVNVAGGIEAWSVQVDPAVPRY
jgi:sulfur-carrier protein adenylyltransferase/sulfurtransferase